MNLAIFLILLNLFKIAIAPFFPLIGDEAYYWLWSQHLDWSYVDHPPMIAYVNYFLTTLFGNSEIAVRLGAIGIVVLISLIVYLTGKELYDKRAGAMAVIIFNLLPIFFAGGMFLVPQTILFLFWALSFYLMVKIVKTGRSSYWYLLGLSVGLGLLSDYIMALFFVATGAFLLFNREQRFWFSRKEPYLGALLSMLIFSPVIFWNITHSFPSLSYHGERAASLNLEKFLNFVVLQMALYTPLLFIAIFKNLFDSLRKLSLNLMNAFSLSVFLPFAILSPFILIGGHWPAAAYLPPLLSSGKSKKVFIILTIAFALLVNSLGFVYYLFLYPTPKELVGKEYKINQELEKYIKESKPKYGRTLILANNLGLAGLISFHGKTKIYLPPGKHPQYDLWGKPELKKGDNLIYFALNDRDLDKELRPLFREVWREKQKRIFTKDADIPTKTDIFHCLGFRGGKLP